MIDPKQFLDHVIRLTLIRLGPKFEGLAAEQLLLGTALKESRLTYLKQIGGGPALGLYQIEPATHQDLWDNYLRYRKSDRARLTEFCGYQVNRTPLLLTDLAYATAVARLIYFRVPHPLPAAGDFEEMGHYWKDHYNTHLGAGKAEDFTTLLAANWNVDWGEG